MKTTRRFFDYDYNTSLFPMRTTKSFARTGIKRALEFSEECVSSENSSAGFTQQTKAYASKPGFHLRRTVKLDPLAEIFIYDKMFKNRSLFLEPKSEHCKHFGYRFTDDDRPLSATESYGGFRKAQTYYENFYEDRGFAYSLSFDVASYFNSMRHNDLIDWFQRIGASNEDVKSLDVFLEGIAPDRSSDCWPQGIYPTKMMGADFLRVIEEDIRIKAKARIRFLDDFVLFSDSENDLIDDFFLIQKILGARGLSVNASKTIFKAHDSTRSEAQKEKDEPVDVRKQLVDKRHLSIQQAYTLDFDESSPGIELTDDERRYIAVLFESKDLTEDDADLVVSLARGCEEEVKKHLPSLAGKYPHLAKNVWALSKNFSEDSPGTVFEILDAAANNNGLQEYQIFWFSEVASELNRRGVDVSRHLLSFYKHRNATDLSRAKILEINSNDVWLRELRREHLDSGRSDWMVWASLQGSMDVISEATVSRYSAIANASPVNRLILESIRYPQEWTHDDEEDDLPAF